MKLIDFDVYSFPAKGCLQLSCQSVQVHSKMGTKKRPSDDRRFPVSKESKMWRSNIGGCRGQTRTDVLRGMNPTGTPLPYSAVNPFRGFVRSARATVAAPLPRAFHVYSISQDEYQILSSNLRVFSSNALTAASAFGCRNCTTF